MSSVSYKKKRPGTILTGLLFLLSGSLSIVCTQGYSEAEAIKKAWENLATKKSCLAGCRDYNPQRPFYRCEGSAFSTAGWVKVLRSDSDILNNFLLSKIKSTRKTAVHVCPYENALEGELAVYCLQHVNKINRFDLDNNILYRYYISPRNKQKEIINKPARNPQEELQNIIRSSERRKIFSENWSLFILYHKNNH